MTKNVLEAEITPIAQAIFVALSNATFVALELAMKIPIFAAISVQTVF